MRMQGSARTIFAAVMVALVLRLAFGFFYWTGKPLTHDEREYLALASSLAAGQGFTYPPHHEVGTGQQFGRAPGYPLFLLAIGATHQPPHAPANVKVAQALLGALVVWMLGLIAQRAVGDRAGAISAWVAAAYPPLVVLPAYVFSESLYMPVAFGCVILLASAYDRARDEGAARGGLALTVMAGLAAGAAILVRPGMLLFLPFAVLWLLRARLTPLAIAFCVTALLVVMPWTLRNAREYGRFVLVASEGGVTFWTGNHPLARGEGDLAANPDIKRAEIAFRQAHPGLSAEELEPLYYRDALGYIASNPGWWLWLAARKLFYTFVPIGPSYALHSTRYLVATVAPYLLIAPLGFIGLLTLVRRTNAATPLLLLALSVVVTAVIFFPQERFRIPVLDPALIVCASVVLSRATQTAR